jgi:YrbI family 3-deoxy-D-manno-octulosonate 8-phosphate phosphatase
MSLVKLTAATRALLRRVRLVVFDFDGVFTDNAVWVGQDGTEMVRCWRSDGLGLSRLLQTGVQAMVLSTEENPVVAARCRKLKLRCEQGLADKEKRLMEIVREQKRPLVEVAYVGNDINDAGCLHRVGLPIVVADAHPAVARLGRLRTSRPGGYGAVREICDAIADLHLKSKR